MTIPLKLRQFADVYVDPQNLKAATDKLVSALEAAVDKGDYREEIEVQVHDSRKKKP